MIQFITTGYNTSELPDLHLHLAADVPLCLEEKMILREPTPVLPAVADQLCQLPVGYYSVFIQRNHSCQPSQNRVVVHRIVARVGDQFESDGVRALDLFNHRQVDIIRHALKHPYQQYTIESHRASHNVVYQTARTDLLDLKNRGVLEQKKKGKQMVFGVPRDLSTKLKKLGKQV